MKSIEFHGLLVAHFRTSFARGTAGALLRGRNMTTGDGRVWATQDLPIPVRAQKLFLLSLRWQLRLAFDFAPACPKAAPFRAQAMILDFYVDS